MSNETTELVFIMDRSGSMGSMAEEAIGGFNAFLEEQQGLPDKANLSLVLFDHEYNLVFSGKDIKKVEPLCNKTYVPRGTTALLDAVGRTIDEISGRLNKACPTCGHGEKHGGKVLVAVLTDGLENASKDYTKDKINELISKHEKDHSWEFIFLAANQDAIKEGGSLGVMASKAMTYDFTNDGFKRGFQTISASTSLYRTNASKFKSVDIKNLVDDDGNVKES